MTIKDKPSGQQVAYMRVSTSEQSTARQLQDTGVNFDAVYEEKASAGSTKRPELQACLNHLRAGDTLHVHSIDRLARNLMDLQRIVDDLNARGITVRFHKEGLAFTGQNDHIGKLMLQMMGAFAEFERAIIRERQREGIEKAKQKGVYKGRKPNLNATQVEELKKRYLAGGQTRTALATEFGISRQTLYRLVK